MMKYITFFSLLLLTACATINSVQPGKGSTFEIRGKSYSQVWKAAVVVASRSLTIVESDKETGVIKAEKAAGMATWGEVVGIYITPANKPAKVYTVEVVSLKRSQVQITGQDWTRTVITGMKAELE